MTIHSRIKFNPSNHTYTLDGRLLPSVTTILKPLSPPFDAAGHSARIAARDGVPVADVLAAWKAKSEAGLDRGRKLHAAAELVLAGKGISMELAKLNMPEIAAWRSWWAKAGKNLTPVMVENIVGDAELGVAGTLDLLARSSKTGQLMVFDWKTGDKFGVDNPWNRFLLPPFGDVPDDELHRYSLQVSLYRLILERDGETGPLGESYIVHLNGSATAHKSLDYRERLERWLLK